MTMTITETNRFGEPVSEHSWSFGESLDRLVVVEMRSPSLAYGKIRPLHDAIVEGKGRRSPTVSASLALKAAVASRDRVLLVTGAGPPPFLPHGENDGPVGADSRAGRR